MALTPNQTRITKSAAGLIIPNPTPTWKDTGDDQREELRQRLLSRLRETQNTGIAAILEQEPDSCWTIFQQKMKSMRWHQRNGTFPAPVDNCAKLLLWYGRLTLDRQTERL